MDSSGAFRVAELRHRRTELRTELARVRWWLRLLRARKDLFEAVICSPGETAAIDMADAWEALAADAPTTVELARVLWGGMPPADALVGLDKVNNYLQRMRQYEERCIRNLDEVTSQFVAAMAQLGLEQSAAVPQHHEKVDLRRI